MTIRAELDKSYARVLDEVRSIREDLQARVSNLLRELGI